MFIFLFQVFTLAQKSTNYNKYTYEISQHHRLLQNSTKNVTDYEWDYLRLSIQFVDENLPQNYSNYMRRVFATTQLFFQKYLLVRRTNQFLQWNTSWGKSIYNIPIPDKLLQQQYDADYVLFVDVQYSPSAGYLTYCGSVQFDNITQRPIFGLLSWNLAYMTIFNETDAQFEIALDIGLHVIMNALGFQVGNFQKFYDSATGQPYINPTLTQVGRTYYLSTPRITQYLRDYFNCTTLQGALLENNGGNGIALNNLERTVFYKEIMTASELVGDMYLTEVTMQFLQDTGFYRLTEYNADEQTWGKNKGCSFVTSQCNQPGFDEFCQINSIESCSQDYEGISLCSFDFFSNRCAYQQIRPQYECRDATNQLNSPDRGVFDYFGYNSMCFNGSLSKNTSVQPVACYKFSCDQNGNLTIIIDQKQYSCSQNSSFSPDGYNGTVYCPADQKWICDNQDECPNYCNKNGICFGGKCLCALGFGGLGCDVECLFYRFKDQCLTSCPDGYYPRDDVSYCIGCPANCKTCSNYKSCQECNPGYRLRGGFCDYQQVQYTLADVPDMSVVNNTQQPPQVIEDTPPIINSSYPNISVLSQQRAQDSQNLVISSDLLQTEWKNIRIAYDFLKPYNRWLTNFITQAFEIVDIFLSKQLLVRPSQSKLQFIQGWNTQWLGQEIPDNIQKKSYQADIVFLISLDYNSNSNQKFNSAPIYGDANYSGRPIFSIISFNMAQIDITNLSNDQYQQLLQMICKQVLIGLGLHKDSINLYFDSVTGKPYKQIATYQNQILYLTTPRLFKYGQTHFNCYDLPGIRIDNQSTFAQSQVGRELLSDADPNQNLLLSQFTFSLLQDTGYYRVAELLPDVNIWGMKKGCDFAINTCNSTKSYFNEFCYNTSSPQSCSFDRAGIAKCVLNQQDQCGYQVITKSCKDKSIQDINYYQQYGYNSICFFTNITTQPNICLPYNCTEGTNLLNITISNQTLCQLKGQVLEPQNINFNISCPSNPQTYCSFQNDCPSQCSQRGYCMGGRCTCLWGYSGLGCEQQCSGFRYHSQCVKECPINTFASSDTQYCVGCPSNCNYCTNHNICEICQRGFVLRGGFCDYQYSDREQSSYSALITLILYFIF